jgi:hypothetical protein
MRPGRYFRVDRNRLLRVSVGLDPSVLLSFYQSKLSSAAATSTATAQANSAVGTSSTTSSKTSATAADNPPWETAPAAQNVRDAQALSTTNFLNTTNVPLTAGSSTDTKTEQDNQKLFSLYSALNSLSYLASMAGRDGTTSGQAAGIDTRFQAGLAQVQSYISNTTFNNFTLQAAAPTNTVTSSVTVPFSSFDYQTKTLTNNANLTNPLLGLSSSDSFTIAIKKGSTTSNVDIDLSKVQGALTLTNVVSYVNQTLAAGGYQTRFQQVLTSGSVLDPTTATYGLQVSPGGSETVSLSSAAATPSLYLVGSSGNAAATTTATTAKDGTASTSTQSADQQGRLIKLSDIDSSPTSTVSVSAQPTTGTTTAQSTVVDSSGNVYVLGSATGDYANQVNQGTQDAYLTKYDSAGNVLWTRMLGSSGSATGTGLALDPQGGVVITGTTTADLSPTSVSDGNNDSFASRYDANGNQIWTTQLQTLNNNQAASVSVDASGNVYIGGQTTGAIGAGQTKIGSSDAYVAQLSSKGKLVYEQQFGTTSADSVGATATGSDGSLYVASTQNGHAIISKYANGDARTAPVWTQDLGDLQNGGAIGGLTVSGSNVYVSGTTQNANLTAGGQASVANASSGGSDAFVFNITDQGATATANYVSYVGTGGIDKGGQVTVGGDGTVYLTGSTTGTFAGQTRNIANVSNAFATALSPNGAVQWTKQYGGLDGVSSGNGIAIDESGASVLDALGLPKGTINPNQSVDLTAVTTLRAGDSFKLQLQGVGARTANITIDQGESLQSLVTKINSQLGSYGKAAVAFKNNAEGISITANAGETFTLASGPAGFDALSRLGLSPGTLTAPSANSSATTTTTSSSSTTTQSFGLGLGDDFDLTNQTGADLARSQLLGVLSKIQSAYQTTNAPAAPTATVGNTSGTASAYTTAQLGNYNLALSLLGGSSSSTSVSL